MTTKQGSILLIATGIGIILLVAGTLLVLIQDESSSALEAIKRREEENADPFSPPPAVRVETARRAVLAGGVIDMSIQRFRLRMGRLPSSLDELVHPPRNLSPTQRWDGPYINNPRLIVDPWDRAYQYQSPGAHNPSGYDIWSQGPDGLDQTDDDIGNW